MKTFSLKQGEIVKKWFVVDATGVTLGRLASQIAAILRGKHKPTFTPHLDCGDNVVVINAAKIGFKGDALAKTYYRYSGYPGGMKSISLEHLLEKKPEKVIMLAVKGMLSRNPLGRRQLRNLRVYGGAEHEQAAQQPVALEIKG
jgi:large subunit ribosomal protein L13